MNLRLISQGLGMIGISIFIALLAMTQLMAMSWRSALIKLAALLGIAFLVAVANWVRGEKVNATIFDADNNESPVKARQKKSLTDHLEGR
jgi:hypothetical protein